MFGERSENTDTYIPSPPSRCIQVGYLNEIGQQFEFVEH